MPPSSQKPTLPPSRMLPPSTNGAQSSVLSTAVAVSEVQSLYYRVLLYGRNGIGKTTMACQFPKPLLLVSFEPSPTGGALSVRKVPGVDYIRISQKALPGEKHAGSKKTAILLDELSRGCPYKTVVADTVTSFQDIILAEMLGLSAIPEMLSWGLVSEEQYRDRSSKTREALRPFLDLNCHVVFCAQEKDHNPPKDRSLGSKLTRPAQAESHFAADLGGATVKWLQDGCDYVCQMYQDKETRTVEDVIKVGTEMQRSTREEETGKMVRRLRTMYHPNYSARVRSDDPITVPEYITAVTPNEMYVELIKVISGIKTAKGKY